MKTPPWGKIGTVVMGVLIMSFAKVACHQPQTVKRMSEEERQQQAKEMALKALRIHESNGK